MKNIIITAYKRESDNDLVGSIHRITGKMENNPVFPNPPAVLGEIKADVPAFIAAITKASGGDEEAMSGKKDLRTSILIKLGILAEYVTLTCGGDRTKLLSSGFELNRARGEKSLSSKSCLPFRGLFNSPCWLIAIVTIPLRLHGGIVLFFTQLNKN